MTRRTLAAVALVLTLSLAGCGGTLGVRTSTFDVELPSGIVAECIYHGGGNDGGLWCRELPPPPTTAPVPGR